MPMSKGSSSMILNVFKNVHFLSVLFQFAYIQNRRPDFIQSMIDHGKEDEERLTIEVGRW